MLSGMGGVVWHLGLQLCIAAALLFGGGRGRGKKRFWNRTTVQRQVHACAQFSFTDPSVCSPRSCDCPFPGPKNQYSWLPMPSLGDWAHTGQAEHQKKCSHCPRSLLYDLTLISCSEVCYNRVRTWWGRSDAVSAIEVLASNVFIWCIEQGIIQWCMNPVLVSFLYRVLWQLELPE